MGEKALNVLTAIDGSEAAGIALELVSRMHWPPGTTIRVIEAIQSGANLFSGPWAALETEEGDRLEEAIRDAAEKVVRDAAARPAARGFTVETAVVTGRPANAILEEAARFGADVVVVGSRGHGAITSMLLGSVSSEVVAHARVPVIVARGNSVERVVVAWDGSPSAARAADLLLQWPIFAESRVWVVSVADLGAPWWTGFPVPGSVELLPVFVEVADAVRAQHQQLAKELTAKLQAAGLRAEAVCREGDPATELISASWAHKADLIVMGTRGRTGLERLLLGSVARNVLRHAPASVLVVRATPDGTGAADQEATMTTTG